MRYYGSLLLVIGGIVVYHLSLKRVSGTLNPFFALVIAYGVAGALSLAGMLAFPEGERSFAALNKWNVGVALGVLGVEVGFLMAYRAGWHMGYVGITANALSALALIPIGIILHQEPFTPTRALGALLCVGGLFLLMAKPS